MEDMLWATILKQECAHVALCAVVVAADKKEGGARALSDTRQLHTSVQEGSAVVVCRKGGAAA